MTVTGTIEQAETTGYLYSDSVSGDMLFRSITSNNFLFGFNSNRPSALAIMPTGVVINGDPGTFNTANFTLYRARASNAQLQTGDVIGSVNFTGRNGTASNVMANITGIYTGTGTNKSGDIVLNTEANSGLLERMRITSAGNVGIGSTAPQFRLDVNGTLGTQRVNLSNFANDVVGSISANNGQFLSIEAYNSNNAVKRNILMAPWGGSVGIGTTATPSFPLDVSGTVRGSQFIVGSNNQAANGQAVFHLNNPNAWNSNSLSLTAGFGGYIDKVGILWNAFNAGNNFYGRYNSNICGWSLLNETSQTLDFQCYGADRIGSNILQGVAFRPLTIGSNYVQVLALGVNTSPAFPLDVNGIANVTTLREGGVGLSNKYAPSNVLSNYLLLSGGTLTGSLSATSITEGGTVLSTKYAPSNTLSNFLRISGGTLSGNLTATTVTASNGNFSNLTVPGTLTVVNSTETNVTTSNVSASNMTIVGSVGIGTTTPQQKLQLYNGDIGVYNGSNVMDAGGSVLFAPSPASITGAASFGSMASIQGRLVNANGTFSNFSGGLSFSVRPYIVSSNTTLSEAMRINHDGNVGIGTNTPSSRLDVNGETRFKGRLNMIDLNSASNMILGSVGGDAAGDVHLYDNGNARTVFGYYKTPNNFGFASASVGIGTTNPQSRLDVNGNARISGNLGIGGLASSPFYVGTTLSYSNTDTRWVNYMTNNGGNGSFTGMHMSSGDNASQSLLMYSGGSFPNGAAIIQSKDTLGLRNYGQRLLLNPDGGNVGIGTTNPGFTFDVNGNMNGTGFLQFSGTKTSWNDKGIIFNGIVAGGTANSNFFMSRGADSNTKDHIIIHTDSTVSGAGVNFMTNGAVSRLFISGTNGNVGIGSTNPGYALDVNGTVRSSGGIFDGVTVNSSTFASAVYTPSFNSINPGTLSVSSPTNGSSYQRIGNTVICQGRITCTSSTTATYNIIFRMTLPINSGASNVMTGTCMCGTVAGTMYPTGLNNNINIFIPSVSWTANTPQTIFYHIVYDTSL
jgi:hypothetical protein